MAAGHEDQVTLRFDVVVVLHEFILGLLCLQEFAENRALEVEQALEVLLDNCVSLLLPVDSVDGEIVALNDSLQLLGHSFRMRLGVPLVILEVVDVVAVAGPVDLHGLQELAEFSIVRLSVDAEDVGERHGACGEIADANRNQVKHCSVLRILGRGQRSRTEQVHFELGWQLGIRLGERVELQIVGRSSDRFRGWFLLAEVQASRCWLAMFD